MYVRVAWFSLCSWSAARTGLQRAARPDACKFQWAASLRHRHLGFCCLRVVLGGRCSSGTKCRFAHSEDELRAKPDLTCTRMCLFTEKGPRERMAEVVSHVPAWADSPRNMSRGKFGPGHGCSISIKGSGPDASHRCTYPGTVFCAWLGPEGCWCFEVRSARGSAARLLTVWRSLSIEEQGLRFVG